MLSRPCAVIDGVNELAGESKVPSSAEEGWMRDEVRSSEATKYAQTGWCWSNSIIFLDQHHPGAHQEMGHPSGLC